VLSHELHLHKHREEEQKPSSEGISDLERQLTKDIVVGTG